MVAKNIVARVFWVLPSALILFAMGCEVNEPDVEPGADWGYVYAVIESNCSCHMNEEV